MGAATAKAVLKALRTARLAASRGRPLGQRDLLRVYQRTLADLAPDREAGPDEPGYRYIVLASLGLSKCRPGEVKRWSVFRPRTVAFRRIGCGGGGHGNNRSPWLPHPRPSSAK